MLLKITPSSKYVDFLVIVGCLVSSTFVLCSMTADDDRVLRIPGIDNQPLFSHYSGYLQGSSSNYQLHYWFAEAENGSISAPLILWLNGGPGCSSMLGLLTENGPFTVRPNVKLEQNPYSWNQFANMLYLESPVGVGYSFAVDNNVTTDDDLVGSKFHLSYYSIPSLPSLLGYFI